MYSAVFGSAEAQQLIQPWNLQPEADHQISIVSDIPAVLSLPWELLHDERGFLALRSKHPVSIVRQVSKRSAGTLKTTFEPPLRILLVTARPNDAGFVNPRSIARELLASISEQVEEGTIELEFLRPPTVAQLRKRLSNSKLPPIHILHFDGHSAFGEMNGVNDGLMLKSGGPRGMLVFENEQGREDLIDAEGLAQVLQDSGVKLTVFNACQSAVVDTDEQALLILRVLETLQQSSPEMLLSSEEEVSLEELPAAVLVAMQQGDETAFKRAFEALSEEEQERMDGILRISQEDEGDGANNVDEGKDAM